MKPAAQLLIATTNPGKRIEIQEILADFTPPLELKLPLELGIDLEVPETGHSYAENAALKSLAYAARSGLPALADDSGLEVETLDGAPGLFSARYAPQPGATDADRRRYLLANLAGKPRPWKARFVCAVALALPDGRLLHSRGECPGEIIPQELGSNGFGYDPIFWMPEFEATMAQLSAAQKNRISHRAQALRAAFPLLAQVFSQD